MIKRCISSSHYGWLGISKQTVWPVINMIKELLCITNGVCIGRYKIMIKEDVLNAKPDVQLVALQERIIKYLTAISLTVISTFFFFPHVPCKSDIIEPLKDWLDYLERTISTI